jgi:hypothetical protein
MVTLHTFMYRLEYKTNILAPYVSWFPSHLKMYKSYEDNFIILCPKMSKLSFFLLEC